MVQIVIYEIYLFDHEEKLLFSHSLRKMEIDDSTVNQFKSLLATLKNLLKDAFYKSSQTISFYEKKIFIQPFKRNNKYLFQVIVCDQLDSLSLIRKLSWELIYNFLERKHYEPTRIQQIVNKRVGRRNFVKLATGIILYAISLMLYILVLHSYFLKNTSFAFIGVILAGLLAVLSGSTIGNSDLSTALGLIMAFMALPIFIVNSFVNIHPDVYVRILLGLAWMAISYIGCLIGGTIYDKYRIYDEEGAKLYFAIIGKLKIRQEK